MAPAATPTQNNANMPRDYQDGYNEGQQAALTVQLPDMQHVSDTVRDLCLDPDVQKQTSGYQKGFSDGAAEALKTRLRNQSVPCPAPICSSPSASAATTGQTPQPINSCVPSDGAAPQIQPLPEAGNSALPSGSLSPNACLPPAVGPPTP
jgi:hypothetical protein